MSNKPEPDWKDAVCPFKRFNKYFKMFIRELSKSYPQVGEYKFILAGYKILKTVSKKLPLKLWKDTITNDMIDAITQKNGDYFTSPEFTVAGYENISDMMKREWKGMDTHSRDIVWQHMQCLVVLSRQC